MAAMTESETIVSLQVQVELPPENWDEYDRVVKIIKSLFEDDLYDVNLTVSRGEELEVSVHVPMLSNAGETSWLKPDDVAAVLIKQRLRMSL